MNVTVRWIALPRHLIADLLPLTGDVVCAITSPRGDTATTIYRVVTTSLRLDLSRSASLTQLRAACLDLIDSDGFYGGQITIMSLTFDDPWP